MENLINNYNGVNFPKGLFWKRDKQKIYDRLAEYESLGVTPEQIRQIDDLYAEKCKELIIIKDEIRYLLSKLKKNKLSAFSCDYDDRDCYTLRKIIGELKMILRRK